MEQFWHSADLRGAVPPSTVASGPRYESLTRVLVERKRLKDAFAFAQEWQEVCEDLLDEYSPLRLRPHFYVTGDCRTVSNCCVPN